MLRHIRVRLCAEKSPSPKAEVVKKQRQAKPLSTFRPLPIRDWQKEVLLSTDRGSHMPTKVYFHGTALGPRPLIVLGRAGQAETADASVEADEYSPLLSQIGWSHGALYIPIPSAAGGASTTLLTDTSHAVASLLDMLGVGWTHVLGHGVGALAACKLTYLHPSRVGTIAVLDTPLVDKAWVANSAMRSELHKAQLDVNVPARLISERIATLKKYCEGPLQHVSEADSALYRDVLFQREALFGDSEGCRRCDSRYLSIEQLASIRHPLQFVFPAAGSVCDVDVHKDFFNIRRVQPIKGASSHKDLFSGIAAEEAGSLLEQWLHRFEPDTIMARRYENAAKDMKGRMHTPAAAAAGGAGEAPAKPHPPSKRKDQKKK